MKSRLSAFVGFGLLAGTVFFAGCKPPKYIEYRSELGDYSCQVPWGWNVYFDKQGADFTNYSFVGPLDEEFFLGLPSMSVRWYAHNRPHKLRDGTSEMYSSADDYIRQMLRDVYGPDYRFSQKPHSIKVSGWMAKHFEVISVAKVPASYHYGVAQDLATKETGVVRKHAYVVLPMDNGFYVMVYPATRQGFEKHIKKFNNLVRTFHAYNDGPGGPKL